MEGEARAPRVSVVMPVRNGMPYLAQSVESILRQTFSDFELIIIDDASTDSTAQYLAGLGDPRVRAVRNERNLGIARTLNLGLRLARAKYIARQDADDVSLPERFEKQYAFLERHRDVAVLGTNWAMIDDKGAILLHSAQVPNRDLDIKWGLLFGCCVLHPSVMVRSEVLAAADGYPERAEFCYAEDYELWCRIARNHRVAALPEVLVQWRFSSCSVTTRYDQPQLEQALQISFKNIRFTMESDGISRRDYDAVRAMFHSRGGRDPQLPRERVRAAVNMLDALQKAFYGKYPFPLAAQAAHRRHWYWIWGKHLLALSLRSGGGIVARLTLCWLGIRYMVRLVVASFPFVSSRSHRREAEVVQPIQNAARSAVTPSKKVLVTALIHGVGGVETHIRSLCELLVREGAEVTLACRFIRWNAPVLEALRNTGVRIMATPFAAINWPRASLAWAAIVWPLRLRRKFDAVYAMDGCWLIAVLAGLLRPGGHTIFNPIIMNDPGSESFSRSMLDPRAEGAVSAFLCESIIGARLIREVYGTNARVAVMPLLSDVGSAPLREWRPHNELRVAFIGRYHRVKGLYRLLELWPSLAIGPAHLDFYGFGEERDVLRQAVSERGLSETVEIHEGCTDKSDLHAIFNRTDLLVLLSESEGVPLSLLEAMAHGVPFVATDVGGVRTLAENNPDVRVVPLDNGAIKRAIEEMAAGIRGGLVKGNRLQQYHERRYGYEFLSGKWRDALLNPEHLWGSGLQAGHCNRPYSVLAGRLWQHAWRGPAHWLRPLLKPESS